MEKELTIKITDPETGEFVVKTKKQSEILDLVNKATERGLVLEQMPPEKATSEVITPTGKEMLKRYGEETSSQDSFVGGLLSGLSLGAKEEIQGYFGDEKQQRRAELQSAAQQKESPISYGAGKFVGGLVPMGTAALAGAKLGGAVGGPWGALVGGGLGAGLAGMGESALSKTMEERKREGLITGGDVGMGLLSGVTEGAGRAVAPYITGITRKLLDKITARPTSTFTALEKTFIKDIDELRKLEVDEIPKLKIALDDAEAALKDQVDSLGGFLAGGHTKLDIAARKAKEALEEAIKIFDFKKQALKQNQEKLMSSPQYSEISATAPSALATIPESEMTPEQKKEFQQYLAQEALRELQQRKRLEREMSIRTPPM